MDERAEVIDRINQAASDWLGVGTGMAKPDTNISRWALMTAIRRAAEPYEVTFNLIEGEWDENDRWSLHLDIHLEKPDA